MTRSAPPRLTLGLVAAAFLAPFLIAAALRFGGWQPHQTRNYGFLLDPPQPMSAVVARSATDGRVWVFENTEQAWTLLARIPPHCGVECRALLETLQRVRTALGRHAGRLHPFAIDPPPAGLAWPVLHLEGTLPEALSAAPARLPEVWLVDPHGYLVLRYPEGFDPNGLRRDLSRLIK
ncbi:MAG: hypothetical protein KatS3mg126_1773 [Lysobacteraceae bacterium]|nr:MAG: hypothetical protein KatS3mg126_1773 [Xanthomonadaceae bacterium]